MTDSQIIFEKDTDEPQIHVTKEGYSRTFQLGITKALLNKKITEDIKQYQNEVRVPGFRKGKVPISVIRNRLPDEEINMFLRRMVRDQIDNHLNESDKIVIGTPDVQTDFSEESGLAAKVFISYEICPEVPEIDFSLYNLVKFIPQDRVKLLEQIRIDFLTANPEKVPQEKGYKSKIGDMLKVDIAVEAPETNAHGFVDRGRDVQVEENSSLFGEEFNSIGLEVEEEFSVDGKLPSFYENYEFEGHPCKFNFKVLEIYKNIKLDEPTLEMAKKFGFGSIEELDEVLLERKLQQFESISTNILRNQFAYEIKKDLSFDVPSKVLNTMMEDIYNERKKATANKEEESPAEENQEDAQGDNGIQNEAGETDIEGRKEVDWATVDPDEVAEIKSLATKSVRYLVLLKDIAKKEDIKTNREEIMDEWSLYVSKRSYEMGYQYDHASERKKLKFEDIPESFVITTQQRITLAKVETFLLGKVGSTETKISFKKLLELREKETFENFQEYLQSEDLVQENEASQVN